MRFSDKTRPVTRLAQRANDDARAWAEAIRDVRDRGISKDALDTLSGGGDAWITAMRNVKPMKTQVGPTIAGAPNSPGVNRWMSSPENPKPPEVVEEEQRLGIEFSPIFDPSTGKLLEVRSRKTRPLPTTGPSMLDERVRFRARRDKPLTLGEQVGTVAGATAVSSIMTRGNRYFVAAGAGSSLGALHTARQLRSEGFGDDDYDILRRPSFWERTVAPAGFLGVIPVVFAMGERAYNLTEPDNSDFLSRFIDSPEGAAMRTFAPAAFPVLGTGLATLGGALGTSRGRDRMFKSAWGAARQVLRIVNLPIQGVYMTAESGISLVKGEGISGVQRVIEEYKKPDAPLKSLDDIVVAPFLGPAQEGSPYLTPLRFAASIVMDNYLDPLRWAHLRLGKAKLAPRLNTVARGYVDAGDGMTLSAGRGRVVVLTEQGHAAYLKTAREQGWIESLSKSPEVKVRAMEEMEAYARKLHVAELVSQGLDEIDGKIVKMPLIERAKKYMGGGVDEDLAIEIAKIEVGLAKILATDVDRGGMKAFGMTLANAHTLERIVDGLTARDGLGSTWGEKYGGLYSSVEPQVNAVKSVFSRRYARRPGEFAADEVPEIYFQFFERQQNLAQYIRTEYMKRVDEIRKANNLTFQEARWLSTGIEAGIDLADDAVSSNLATAWKQITDDAELMAGINKAKRMQEQVDLIRQSNPSLTYMQAASVRKALETGTSLTPEDMSRLGPAMHWMKNINKELVDHANSLGIGVKDIPNWVMHYGMSKKPITSAIARNITESLSPFTPKRSRNLVAYEDAVTGEVHIGKFSDDMQSTDNLISRVMRGSVKNYDRLLARLETLNDALLDHGLREDTVAPYRARRAELQDEIDGMTGYDVEYAPSSREGFAKVLEDRGINDIKSKSHVGDVASLIRHDIGTRAAARGYARFYTSDIAGDVVILHDDGARAFADAADSGSGKVYAVDFNKTTIPNIRDKGRRRDSHTTLQLEQDDIIPNLNSQNRPVSGDGEIFVADYFKSDLAAAKLLIDGNDARTMIDNASSQYLKIKAAPSASDVEGAMADNLLAHEAALKYVRDNTPITERWEAANAELRVLDAAFKRRDSSHANSPDYDPFTRDDPDSWVARNEQLAANITETVNGAQEMLDNARLVAGEDGMIKKMQDIVSRLKQSTLAKSAGGRVHLTMTDDEFKAVIKDINSLRQHMHVYPKKVASIAGVDLKAIRKKQYELQTVEAQLRDVTKMRLIEAELVGLGDKVAMNATTRARAGELEHEFALLKTQYKDVRNHTNYSEGLRARLDALSQDIDEKMSTISDMLPKDETGNPVPQVMLKRIRRTNPETGVLEDYATAKFDPQVGDVVRQRNGRFEVEILELIGDEKAFVKRTDNSHVPYLISQKEIYPHGKVLNGYQIVTVRQALIDEINDSSWGLNFKFADNILFTEIEAIEMYAKSISHMSLVNDLMGTFMLPSEELLAKLRKNNVDLGMPVAPTNWVTPEGFGAIKSKKVTTEKVGSKGGRVTKTSDWGEYRMHPVVYNHMQQYFKRSFDSPGKAADFIDSLTNYWKSTVTSAWPQFHMRNAVNNVWTTITDLGADSARPSTWYPAFVVHKRARQIDKLSMEMRKSKPGSEAYDDLAQRVAAIRDAPVFTDIGNKVWTYGELIDTIKQNRVALTESLGGSADIKASGGKGYAYYQERPGARDFWDRTWGAKPRFASTAKGVAKERGVLNFAGAAALGGAGALLTGNIAGLAGAAMLHPTVRRIGGELGQVADDVAKMVIFTKHLKTTGDVGLAVARSKQFLFDYGQLTDIEQVYLKRFMPFYTWTRKNIELQAKLLVDNPNAMANVGRFIETYEHLYGDSPLTTEERTYLEESRAGQTGVGAVMRRNEVGLLTILRGMGTPQEAFLDVLPMGGGVGANAAKYLDFLFTNGHPGVKVASELYTGRSSGLGVEFATYTPTPEFANAPAPVKAFLGIIPDPHNPNEWVSTDPSFINTVRQLPVLGRGAATWRQVINPYTKYSDIFAGAFGASIWSVRPNTWEFQIKRYKSRLGAINSLEAAQLNSAYGFQPDEFLDAFSKREKVNRNRGKGSGSPFGDDRDFGEDKGFGDRKEFGDDEGFGEK